MTLMQIYKAKANPRRTCQAEAYDYHGQRRYRIILGGTPYDLDAETFDEMWEAT
jgi:hypothetical protein